MRPLITQNNLTVSSLTDQLARLDANARQHSLYRHLSFGMSTNSDNAQLIKQRYKQLGVTLSDQDLKNIVYGRLNVQHNGTTFAEKLKNAPYQQWRHRPYSLLARNALERELKGRLELFSAEYESLTLAQSIAAHLQKSSKNTLSEVFNKILNYSPEFLADLINELKNECYEDLIALYNDPTLNPNIKKQLLESSAEIAEKIVAKDINVFTQLTPEMKREVYRRFINNPDHTQIAVQISKHSENIVLRITGSDDINTAYFTIYNYTSSPNASLNNCPLRAHLNNTLNQPKLFPFIHREKALGRIHHYLKTNPSTYKRLFFQKLFDDIEENGLTVERLEKALCNAQILKLFNTATPESFFYKPTDCGSLSCINDLYQLATGKRLTPAEQRQLLTSKNITERLPKPTPTAMSTFQKQHLKKTVLDSLNDPAKAQHTILGRHVLQELDALKSYCDVLTDNERKQQLEGEAKRQQKIFELAVGSIKEPNNIRIDPQGHMLLEVDYEGKTAFCSIDMLGIEQLHQRFIAALKDQSHSEQKLQQGNLNCAVDLFVTSPSRGSVIPLQEEAEFHMRLLSRVIEKLDQHNVISEDKWKKIRLYAAKKLERHIKTIFQNALVQAYVQEIGSKTVSIDIALLNKLLDQERKDLTEHCFSALFEAINNDNAGIGQQRFQSLNLNTLQGKFDKKHFTSTTATGEEYLRTNNNNQTITRITATNYTAHKKSAGQAFRIVHRNRLASNTQNFLIVTPHKHTTMESRVPSIAIKKWDHYDSVNDVAKKLDEDYKTLQAESFNQGPMVYNLLTSFVSKQGEWFSFGFWTPPHRKNRQRLSAARILKGSHIFNQGQVQNGNIHSLCYVQNIPINQHGDNITYDSWDSVRREALIMSDLAILSTLTHHAAHLPPKLRFTIKDHFKKLQGLYTHFLNNSKMGNRYFNDSFEGKGAIKLMKSFKSKIGYACESMPIVNNEPLESLIAKALLKIITTDHKTKRGLFSKCRRSAQEDLQFGTLIQTLSVYLEPMSLAGCKSANERYSMVAGRVELLKSIGERSSDQLSIEAKRLIKTLEQFVAGDNTHIKALQHALDRAYDQHNLFGSHTHICLEDQGAPSKVQATKNQKDPGNITEMNTNIAESALMKLFQSNASILQPHKKLPNRVSELFRKRFSTIENADNRNKSSQPEF